VTLREVLLGDIKGDAIKRTGNYRLK